MLFRKLIKRVRAREDKLETMKRSGQYSCEVGIRKSLPPAVIAFLLPQVVKILEEMGFTVDSEDAYKIVLFCYGAFVFINNWFKNSIRRK